MAKRRMFSCDVIDNDKFLDMSATARLLYYDLGMRADDDGFISPKKVMRMTSATQDDLLALISRGFIIPFESGVIVITNWKMNNYIQKDRYTPTIYKDEKKRLSHDDNNSYVLDTQCIQNVSKMDTQVRLGKDSNIYTYMDVNIPDDESSHNEKKTSGGTVKYGNEDINRFIKGVNKYLTVKLPDDGRARKVAKNSLDMFTKHSKDGTIKSGREFMDDDKWKNVKKFMAEYDAEKISKGYSAQSWDKFYQNIKLWIANSGSLSSK